MTKRVPSTLLCAMQLIWQSASAWQPWFGLLVLGMICLQSWYSCMNVFLVPIYNCPWCSGQHDHYCRCNCRPWTFWFRCEAHASNLVWLVSMVWVGLETFRFNAACMTWSQQMILITCLLCWVPLNFWLLLLLACFVDDCATNGQSDYSFTFLLALDGYHLSDRHYLGWCVGWWVIHTKSH